MNRARTFRTRRYNGRLKKHAARWVHIQWKQVTYTQQAYV